MLGIPVKVCVYVCVWVGGCVGVKREMPSLNARDPRKDWCVWGGRGVWVGVCVCVKGERPSQNAWDPRKGVCMCVWVWVWVWVWV
jgi:hypothetical protein